MPSDSELSRAASRRRARVAKHLHQAGKQLSAATQAAHDRYRQQKLGRLAADLQELSTPIAGLVVSLERVGG